VPISVGCRRERVRDGMVEVDMFGAVVGRIGLVYVAEERKAVMVAWRSRVVLQSCE